MKVYFDSIRVTKRVPLKISRGINAGSENIWLRIEADGVEGWGEASPFSIGNYSQTLDDIVSDLQVACRGLYDLHPFQRNAIEQKLFTLNVGRAARAAIDTALYDWLGKRVGFPLWKLLGLESRARVPTSVTIGISSPIEAEARLRAWLAQTDVRVVKVKLGSSEGIQADQAMFEAVFRGLPPGVQVSVDANGGWNLSDAKTMASWLAERGVMYLEQPLQISQEAFLVELYQESSLPIFVDESCFCSSDIPQLAPYIQGINIKLMKSGGLQEALRMIHTARAHGLKVMFGCYSNTSLGNTAMAHLASLADYLDLDSHLNLQNDPFLGATLKNGILILNNQPGIGLTYHGV